MATCGFVFSLILYASTFPAPLPLVVSAIQYETEAQAEFAGTEFLKDFIYIGNIAVPQSAILTAAIAIPPSQCHRYPDGRFDPEAPDIGDTILPDDSREFKDIRYFF